MICSVGATGDGVRDEVDFSDGEREKLSFSSSIGMRGGSVSGPCPELGSRAIIILASVGVIETGGPCCVGNV